MLKATGIVRKVDELGRVVLPIELRRMYGIEPNSPLEIYTEDNGAIVLKPYAERCPICGAILDERAVKIGEKHICRGCFDAARSAEAPK